MPGIAAAGAGPALLPTARSVEQAEQHSSLRLILSFPALQLIDADMIMRLPVLPHVSEPAGGIAWGASSAGTAMQRRACHLATFLESHKSSTPLQELGAATGTAVSGFFGYMIGEAGSCDPASFCR